MTFRASQVSRRFAPGMGGGMGAQEFRPTMLSGLAAWYRADQGITIATGVSQWNDLSGNGNHLTQGTGSKQPTFVASAQNNRPGVQSDGVDDFLTSSYTIGNTKTIIVAGKWVDAFSAQSTLFDCAAGNTGRLFRTASTALAMFGGAATLPIAGATPTSFHVHSCVFNGASSLYRQDGAQLASGDTGSASATGLVLFSFGSGATDWSQGLVCEAAVYTRVLTASEIARVESYMKARYGL